MSLVVKARRGRLIDGDEVRVSLENVTKARNKRQVYLPNSNGTTSHADKKNWLK